MKIERVVFGPKFSDPIPYRIQISYASSVAGKRIYGYGESAHEVIAYEKALAELLEREALFLHAGRLGVRTTNGLAAHRFTFLAKHSAKMELIERDAFLRHWLTRTPLIKAAESTDSRIMSFRESLDKNDHDLIIARTYLGEVPSTIAVAVNRLTGGFLIGSSAAASPRARARKAVGEAFLSLFGRKNDAISWDHPDFDTHANYWYFRNTMPDWLVGDRPSCLKKANKPRIQYHILSVDPIPVVAATSKDLFDIWVGRTPDQVIGRIEEFYDIAANADPHPFP